MNITNNLLYDFLKKHKLLTIGLVLLSLLMNFLKMNVISYFSANIIQSIQKNNKENAYTFLNYFIMISLTYSIINLVYRLGNLYYSSKLRSWSRYDLIKKLLEINNVNFSDINFTELNSPIFRLSNTIAYIFNSIFNTLIPNITLLFIITGYFLYKNIYLALFFLSCNIIIILYIVFNIKNVANKGIKYEHSVSFIESHIIELLNNIDKIIFRGKIKEETNKLNEISSNLFNQGFKYYSSAIYNELIINMLVFLTVFGTIFYLIYAYFNKK
jgi:ABC-type multidrug transport system fused ATPase/permease subunit